MPREPLHTFYQKLLGEFCHIDMTFQMQWSNLLQSVLACMINGYGHRDRALIRISTSSNMHHLQIEVPNISNPFKQHTALHSIHSALSFVLPFACQVRSLKSLLTVLVFGWPSSETDPKRLQLEKQTLLACLDTLQESNILLMDKILHQLRLVVYPIICKVSYIPGGAGFCPSTVPLAIVFGLYHVC